MKTITIFIPTFNEAGNIRDIVSACIGMWHRDLLDFYGLSSDGVFNICKQLLSR